MGMIQKDKGKENLKSQGRRHDTRHCDRQGAKLMWEQQRQHRRCAVSFQQIISGTYLRLNCNIIDGWWKRMGVAEFCLNRPIILSF